LHADGDFHFLLSDTHKVRLQKTAGGGALRDVGCYLIDFITAIFREEPMKINATGILNTDCVDTQTSSFFTFSEGRSASFTCSFSAPRRNSLEIICERAHLSIDSPFKPEISKGITISATTERTHRQWVDKHSSFMNQFNNFYDVVSLNASPTIALQQSCLNHKILDNIIAQLEQN
jgi:predicted dehydrogenase